MMAPMVSIRPGPTAVYKTSRWSRGSGKGLLRPITTRRTVATNAAIRGTVDDLPGGVPQRSLLERKEAIRNAKPFSDFLTDSFNRQHDYLRISITERCNLRCLYCMPEEGVPLSPPAHLLTTPEIFYLSSLFVSQGVTKIRLTGGEPTVRRDIIPLMQSLGSLRPKGLRDLALTTNGISLLRKLDSMVEAGLTGVNLSLDTLDPFQFQIMTRRNGFDAVMKCIDRILEMKKLGAHLKLKVNCVVMRGLNERDIIPFVELGREKDIEVRFIEYMPFGGNKWSEGKMFSFQEMLHVIRAKYPGLRQVAGHKNDTSKTYEVPGFVGKVGFITSMTNEFCGTCNRLRITSDGNLKVCLHGTAEVSLRDLLRKDNGGEPIDQEAFERIKQIEMDRRDGRLSDETILGWGQREKELLDVIGQAVKRKAEKHADIGDLANMENRPMILIDRPTSANPSPSWHPASHRHLKLSTPTIKSRAATPTTHLPFLYPSLQPNHLAFARAFSTSNVRSDHRSKNNAEKKLKLKEGRAHAILMRTIGVEASQSIRPYPTATILGQKRISKEQQGAAKRGKARKLSLNTQVSGIMSDFGVSPSAKRVVLPKVLKRLGQRIDQLEERLTIEHELPLMEDPGEWEVFKTRSSATGQSRDTKRAVWRKRRKTADKLEAQRKKLMRQHPTIDEATLEDTLKKSKHDIEVEHSIEVAEIQQQLAEYKMRFTKLRQDEAERQAGLKDLEEQKDELRKLKQEKSELEGTAPLREEAATVLREERDTTTNTITSSSSGPGTTVAKREEPNEYRDAEPIAQPLSSSGLLKETAASEVTSSNMGVDALRKKRDELLKRLERLRQHNRLIRATQAQNAMQKTEPQKKDQTKEAVHVKEFSQLQNSCSTVLKAQDQPDPILTTWPEPQEAHAKSETSQNSFQEKRPPNRRRSGSPSPLSRLDQTFKPSIPSPSPPINPIRKEDLRSNLPTKGIQVIDRELSINFDSNVTDLQSQLRKLQNRLKIAYPKIDSLPYEAWKSKNRNMLRTWLKILAKKWETRFEGVGGSVGWGKKDGIDDDVGKVLDEMVMRHELSHDAAERMARRWRAVFERRGAMEVNAEETLDWDEFDAEMGWLRDERTKEERADETGVDKADGTNSHLKSFMSDDGRGGKKSNGLPRDLPLSWDNKSQGAFRSAGSTRNFHTSAIRRYSSTALPPEPPRNTSSSEQTPATTEEAAKSTTTIPEPNALPHLTPSGSAHMVSISAKANTVRTAIAVGRVHFSNPTPLSLIRSNSTKKGDVLSVSRIAGIMAAKQCPNLIPLCHPINLSHVGVVLRLFDSANTISAPSPSNTKDNSEGFGGVEIQAKVQCTGATGVEMEALTAVMGAGLTVVDMCKAVDKGMRVEGVRVVLKEGGRSGTWKEEGWMEMYETV